MKEIISIVWFIAVALWFAAFPTRADRLHWKALEDAHRDDNT
jgi:hypothetical protein